MATMRFRSDLVEPSEQDSPAGEAKSDVGGRLAIVVDTREQEPYVFEPSRVSIVRRKLAAGDYSLDGHEASIAVERKSLDDYVTTVIRERARFGRELELLAKCDVACIVVEASLEDVLEHRYRSGVHPAAVIGATAAIIVDHDVSVYFAGDRQVAQMFVEGLLRRYHRLQAAKLAKHQKTGDV